MFLKDRLLGEDVKIQGFSGVCAGALLCILNDLASIVAGVTAMPVVSMGAVATGVQLDIASSSAADTAAGTGARTITLYGLGPNFIPKVATYTLNGQTVVTTPATDKWLRVFAASVTTVGSGGQAAGTIDIAVTGTGTFTAGVIATPATGGILRIPIGLGSGYSGYYTVPSNIAASQGSPAGMSGQQLRKLKIQGVTLGIAAQNARFLIMAQPNITDGSSAWDGLLVTPWQVEMSGAAGGPGWIDLARHLEDFAPGTDIIMAIIPTAASIVSAVLDSKMV